MEVRLCYNKTFRIYLALHLVLAHPTRLPFQYSIHHAVFTVSPPPARVVHTPRVLLLCRDIRSLSTSPPSCSYRTTQHSPHIRLPPCRLRVHVYPIQPRAELLPTLRYNYHSTPPTVAPTKLAGKKRRRSTHTPKKSAHGPHCFRFVSSYMHLASRVPAPSAPHPSLPRPPVPRPPATKG